MTGPAAVIRHKSAGILFYYAVGQRFDRSIVKLGIKVSGGGCATEKALHDIVNENAYIGAGEVCLTRCTQSEHVIAVIAEGAHDVALQP